MKDSYVPSTDISLLVKKLDNQIQRKIQALYSRREFCGFSVMNLWVADYLSDMAAQGRTVCQKDLEREFSVNRATASKMLSLMEKKQLIRRVEDPGDSRRKQILLEPAGRELQALWHEIQTELEQTLSAALSAEEAALFRALCRKLLCAL